MELRTPSGRSRGFTFIELMVVITIIVMLITMAIPIYSRTVLRSKESVLANNLFTLRTVIDHYTYDQQRAPHNLQELVDAGYLRTVPVDPITGSSNWRTISEEAGKSVNDSDPGIWEVKSASDKIGLDGRPYAEK